MSKFDWLTTMFPNGMNSAVGDPQQQPALKK